MFKWFGPQGMDPRVAGESGLGWDILMIVGGPLAGMGMARRPSPAASARMIESQEPPPVEPFNLEGLNELGSLKKMSIEEALENGLSERDPQWPWRGLHETEGHHPLMEGSTHQEFWLARGFEPDEVQNFVKVIDKDIHRAISESPPGKLPWWDRELLGRIAKEEALQNGIPLEKQRVLDIANELLNEIDKWSPK
jgi:hypothetical protein